MPHKRVNPYKNQELKKFTVCVAVSGYAYVKDPRFNPLHCCYHVIEAINATKAKQLAIKMHHSYIKERCPDYNQYWYWSKCCHHNEQAKEEFIDEIKKKMEPCLWEKLIHQDDFRGVTTLSLN